MDKEGLIEIAISALKNSYAPYSEFFVSAALLCEDGSVYTGNNIENAAYTPTICAERVAIFKAVSEGKRGFKMIAICGGKNGIISDYVAPCGVCRQVMREFCSTDTFTIILAKSKIDYKEYNLNDLLPVSFGPESVI